MPWRRAATRTIPDTSRYSAFRGDLDWIVLRALEKDRARRYATAAGLAADVRRYLEHEPVVARPPSRIYWLGKFIQRHRAAMAATALVIVTLFMAVMALSWQRAEAKQQAETTTSVLSVLGEVFMALGAGADPRDIKADDLDAVAAELEDGGAFADQPRVRSRLHGLIAYSYSTTGRYAEAAKHWEMALELRAAELGEENPEALQTMNNLTRTYLRIDRPQDAEKLGRRALDASRRGVGKEHRITQTAMRRLGTALMENGDLATSERMFRDAIELAKASQGERYLGVPRLRKQLGECLRRQKKYSAAERELKQAAEHFEAVTGIDSFEAKGARKALVELYEVWKPSTEPQGPSQ